VIDVIAVQSDLPDYPATRYQVVHAVYAPQERAFPAARGADEGRDLVGIKFQVDGVQGMKITVVKIQVFRSAFNGRVHTVTSPVV
jgi:hypothetical protein